MTTIALYGFSIGVEEFELISLRILELLLIFILSLIYLHSRAKRKKQKKKPKRVSKDKKDKAVGIAGETPEDVRIIDEILREREIYHLEMNGKTVDVDKETGEVLNKN